MKSTRDKIFACPVTAELIVVRMIPSPVTSAIRVIMLRVLSLLLSGLLPVCRVTREHSPWTPDKFSVLAAVQVRVSIFLYLSARLSCMCVALTSSVCIVFYDCVFRSTGTYQDQYNGTSCKPCSKGWYSLTGGRLCTQAAAGQFVAS